MIPPLTLQPKENIIPIDNWQDYLSDGEKFLHTAAGAFEKRKKAFSEETLYNITAMAIEKFIMAFLMKNGDLAENHTMTDLVAALSRHLERMPEELAEKLHYLDSFQDICDLEDYRRTPPTRQELSTILSTGFEVQALLSPHLH